MRPYIGITGFSSDKEIKYLNEYIPHDTHYQLMCGVLLSNDKLQKEKTIISKRYPDIENIKDIFTDDDRYLNIIHYKLPKNIDQCLAMCNATQIGGKYCDGLQINGAWWPSVSSLRKYKTFYPNNRIILQINRDMLHSITPDKLSDSCYMYKDFITDVLLDESGGTGVKLNGDFLMEFIYNIKKSCPDMGIGIAGGLNAESLDLITDIVDEFHNISIDAESKLRDKYDNLSYNSCMMYLDRAYELVT